MAIKYKETSQIGNNSLEMLNKSLEKQKNFNFILQSIKYA